MGYILMSSEDHGEIPPRLSQKIAAPKRVSSWRPTEHNANAETTPLGWPLCCNVRQPPSPTSIVFTANTWRTRGDAQRQLF